MKTKEVQLPAIKNEEIQNLISNSGIELTEAESYVSAFAGKFAQLYDLSRPLAGLDKKNPTAKDVKIARENRLAIVKVRKGGEGIKDSEKKALLVRTNLIQNTFNILKNSCILTESEYENIEKHHEKIEAAKREELKASRIELLLPYEVNIEFLPLDTMSDETFEKLLLGEQEKHQAIKELRERQEKERIAKEESEKLHKQRKESILHLWSFMDPEEYDTDFSTFGQKAWELYVSGLESHKKEADAELEKLKKEAEEKKITHERRSKEMQPYIVLIRDYNAMINMSEEDYQKLLSDIKRGEEERIAFEKELHDKKIAEMEVRERIIINHLIENGYEEAEGGYWDGSHFIGSNHYSFLESDEDRDEMIKSITRNVELRAEREAKAKLEAELKAKNDAEAKAQAQKLAEEEAKQKESEKIAQLPIKEQLLTWIDTFQISKFAIEDPTAADIIEKFAGFIEWSKKRVHETKDN